MFLTWFNVGNNDDTAEFARAFKIAQSNQGITITIDGNTTYKLLNPIEVFSYTKCN